MGKASFPWTQTSEEVVAQQHTSLENGLTSTEVEARRQQYGYNELDKEPGKPLWKLVLEQFDDMLVKVRLPRGSEGTLRDVATTGHSLGPVWAGLAVASVCC